MLYKQQFIFITSERKYYKEAISILLIPKPLLSTVEEI